MQQHPPKYYKIVTYNHTKNDKTCQIKEMLKPAVADHTLKNMYSIGRNIIAVFQER